MVTTTDRNIGAILHLSQMSKYLFPFGGIIIPLIIWINKRQTSEFADQCGKSVLNFNLSMFLYYLVAIVLFVIGVIYFAIDFQKINEIVNEATPVTLIAFVVIGVLYATLRRHSEQDNYHIDIRTSNRFDIHCDFLHLLVEFSTKMNLFKKDFVNLL